MSGREPWFSPLQNRWCYFWRSDSACAMCRKPERPWRRMMVYPLSTAYAFVCSESCWDVLADQEPGFVQPRAQADFR